MRAGGRVVAPEAGSLEVLRLLVAALGCPAASSPAHFPEDAFARQRQQLVVAPVKLSDSVSLSVTQSVSDSIL